jgi:hypothetical protein
MSSDQVVISVDTHDKWSIVSLTESKIFSWNIVCVLYVDNIRYTLSLLVKYSCFRFFIVFHSSYKEKGAQYRVTFRTLLQYFSSHTFQILEDGIYFIYFKTFLVVWFKMHLFVLTDNWTAIPYILFGLQ